MKRKICVVTGSRADYGLLRWLMQEIDNDAALSLQVIATGTHFSRQHGLTIEEIESDGFKIDFKIDTNAEDDSAIAIAESIGLGIIQSVKAFRKLSPDLIVVLGDRFEIFAAATAALLCKIPLSHIHGGETTVGAYDEAFRHSISKMAQIHFAAAEEYKNRIIQLGENPQNVHLVGGLGVDSLNYLTLLSKAEIEAELGIKFSSRSLLITLHPVTLDDDNGENQTKELISALRELENTTLIFTLPNADTGNKIIRKLIEEFAETNLDCYVFKSLGQLKYLSCISHVDGVVGNSSSGLTEAPSLLKGTINIGIRQLGRLQASSVINCEPNKSSIQSGLNLLFSQKFIASLRNTSNPYGDEGASRKILKILREVSLDGIVRKTFHDI
jgi:GDP/UDP-N,N'-diacetylbacillosamine 2-epimerase (hydrolysing)